jgi:release factor glutamine methyltransferase
MTDDEIMLLNEKYNGQKTEGFYADCARLKKDEPLAYIIGYIPFLNTTIYLDSRPLIPRPETEFWVERAIEHIHTVHARRKEIRVLDLCAGSGCIGVAILKDVETARVDFAEIDASHHPVIARNIKENAIDATRARIFGGDLFEHITDTYDVILANPPYIDPANDRAEYSVTTFEPHIALYGGTHGLAIIERIITNAEAHLAEDGFVYIEHEPEQTQSIAYISGTHGRLTAKTHADQYGKSRYTVLTRETP